MVGGVYKADAPNAKGRKVQTCEIVSTDVSGCADAGGRSAARKELSVPHGRKKKKSGKGPAEFQAGRRQSLMGLPTTQNSRTTYNERTHLTETASWFPCRHLAEHNFEPVLSAVQPRNHGSTHECYSCLQKRRTPKLILDYAEVLKTDAHSLGAHGLGEKDFNNSGVFRGAIERIPRAVPATDARQR